MALATGSESGHLDQLTKLARGLFEATVPSGPSRASLLLIDERREEIGVRRGVVQPWREVISSGVQVGVCEAGSYGYACTAELTKAGLERAWAEARAWAERTARWALIDEEVAERWSSAQNSGRYTTPLGLPADGGVDDASMAGRVELVRELAERLKIDDRLIDWGASLWTVARRSVRVSSDDESLPTLAQEVHTVCPGMGVVADGGQGPVSRSLGQRGRCRQGGLDQLRATGVFDAPERLAREALELCTAPPCPSGRMDLVLAPDQMLLQIHESIGHPLELDRILGDERNYAGTSFVDESMFGRYQYGSELLNVSADPAIPEEMASYGFDDDGLAATPSRLIEDGLLLRPLGGGLSAARAERHDPIACARATAWNRPPIDRMANLNVEPGGSSLEELVAGVERGVWMETNSSWSIDDSRNKFQFGCELGRIIEDGELKGLVKKPNYRGVSATFWRNLTGVGDASTFEVLGTPYCGKGEPNQVIRVGHASPVCRFHDVEVFGGV